MTTRAWIFLCLALLPASFAHAVEQPEPIALKSNVVTSIAAPSSVYRPNEFPVTGRNCGEVLDELRTRESFQGEIRTVYDVSTSQAGQCFNLLGKASQVAVVCCGPESSQQTH